jgi:hypothetical protein
MGELTPLYEIDGRTIENKTGSGITQQLGNAFQKKVASHCEKLP